MTIPTDRLRPHSYLGLFLLALVPRFVPTLAYLDVPIALDDMFQYDMLARSIVSGNGFRWYQREDVDMLRPYLDAYYGIELPTEDVPEEGYLTTFRAPGYPFFLAGIYALSGLEDRIPAARVAQSFLGALLAPLAAMLALRLGLGRRTAKISGVFLSFYPILLMYPVGLASEDLFVPLVLLSCILLLRAATGGTGSVIAAGIALGAATLTRGALVMFLPIAALWLWRRGSFRRAFILSLAVSAVLIPWMVRNSFILGKPSFVENSAGYNLFVGYHPEGNGGFVSEVAVIPTRFIEDQARDQWTRQQAFGFIRSDPGRAFLLSLKRIAYFWGLEGRELIFFYSNDFFGSIPQPWLLIAFLLITTPFVAIGLSAPLGMYRHPSKGRGLVLGLIAALMLVYVPILAEPRFHLPLIPFLCVYASAAWSTPSLVARLRDGARRHDKALIMVFAALLLLVTLWIWDVARQWPTLQAVMGPDGNTLGLAY